MKIQVLQQARKEIFNNELKISPKIILRREQFLLKIPLFQLIHQKKGDQNFQIILDHIQLVQYSFGSVIFMTQEERTFNYILRGSVIIFSKNKNNNTQPKFYKRMEANQHFGEKIQLGKQFIDSARAVNMCYVLQLSKAIFYRTFAGHFKYDQLKDKINFLQSVWVFKQVKKALLQRILLTSETQKLSRNSIIAKQGDKAQALYVILQGELTLHKKKEDSYQSAFCTYIKSEVCGINELLQDIPFQYSIICSSDHVQLLKVQKQIILEIVDRDIEPQILQKRKIVEQNLKKKNLSFKNLIRISQTIYNENTQRVQQQRLTKLNRRRYKSQGNMNDQPLDKMKILNQLFKKQIQLKQQKLRGYKLQFLRQKTKSLYCTNRLSTLVNHSITYDKFYIENYQKRRDRKHLSLIQKEIQFQNKKFNVLPQFNVKRSNAVKNHKRKLNQSRKSFYEALNQA